MESIKKIMESIKNYFKNRTVRFYIAFSTACLSMITAIIYAAALGHLSEYMSWIPIVTLLAGGIAFIALSVFGLSRLGSAIMAALDFVAFLVFLGTIYGWPLEQVMIISGIGDIKELPAIIICAALMLICIVAANVCAWSHIQRKRDAKASAAN